jgi:general secretion pathway protein A
MYRQFYNLKEKPFEITPDPNFLFLSESHKEALAHMVYAARERKGFTVVTGEVGTGKTTLVQAFLAQLNGKAKTAYIFNPKLSATDFIRYIVEDLGVKEEKHTKGQYIAQLHDMLMKSYSRDEQVILIIDEAQSLPTPLLEEVRLLTNLETPKSKLLQVMLIGQPELNKVLNSHEFRQLKQRVGLRYHMLPLSEEDTQKYIEKRLAVAGAADTRLFSTKALKEIYHYSKGIPRLINILCDNALLAGYATGQKIVGNRTVNEVIRQLEGKPVQGRKILYRALVWGIIGLLILTGLALWWGTYTSTVINPWLGN